MTALPKRAASGLVALGLTLAASSAWACPACALNDKNGLGSWFILACFLISPFIVVGSVMLVLRRLAPAETKVADHGVREVAHAGGPRGF